jgi:hypothetical protein
MPTTPDTYKYYPALSELISVEELSDFLNFIGEQIQSVFNKIYYKNYCASKNATGSSTFYSLDADSNYFGMTGGNSYILMEQSTSLEHPGKLEDYLFNKIPSDANNTTSNSEKYKNHFKIFLFDTTKVAPDSSPTSSGGRSNGIDKMIVFTNYTNSQLNNKETIAHEFLHLAGVDHTFANYSPHTFKPLQTDNIMDYSNLNTPSIPELSVFNWQGAIAKKCMDPDPQQDPSEQQ